MGISPNLHVMMRAVEKAAPGLRRDFGELDKLQVSRKGVQNFVTNADIRTEKLVFEELQHARPKFGFLGEESGEVASKEDKFRFVLDPLDGTSNFIHAIPYFCISLGLEEKKADGSFETVAAVIYDPLHDDMFTAEKGVGAFHNRYKLRVSSREDDLFLSTASPRKGKENYKQSVERFDRVTDWGAVVRCSGAAALDLAYLASGRYDAIWYDHLQAWDVSAGMLLVREAGGKISDINGEARSCGEGSLIASNGLIHDALLSRLKESK